MNTGLQSQESTRSAGDGAVATDNKEGHERPQVRRAVIRVMHLRRSLAILVVLAQIFVLIDVEQVRNRVLRQHPSRMSFDKPSNTAQNSLTQTKHAAFRRERATPHGYVAGPRTRTRMRAHVHTGQSLTTGGLKVLRVSLVSDCKQVLHLGFLGTVTTLGFCTQTASNGDRFAHTTSTPRHSKQRRRPRTRTGLYW